MLAAKLMDDRYYSNAFYAKVGGITASELNHMELEMFRMLDYRLIVTGSQLKELLAKVDCLQVPGHPNSLLCKKRPSCEHFCEAPPSPSTVHKPKVAKASQDSQRPKQMSLPGADLPCVAQTGRDGPCEEQQVTTAALLPSPFTRRTSEDCVVLEGCVASVSSVQQFSTMHSSASLALPLSATFVQVHA